MASAKHKYLTTIQVLSLSLHFTEASENIMNYLVNIEEKLKSDIPEELKMKIYEENQKAKVRKILYNTEILPVNL